MSPSKRSLVDFRLLDSGLSACCPTSTDGLLIHLFHGPVFAVEDRNCPFSVSVRQTVALISANEVSLLLRQHVTIVVEDDVARNGA